MGLLSPSNAISIYRGASRTLALTVFNSSTKVPIKLVDVKLIFSVKRASDDRPALVQKTTDFISQFEIIKPSAGTAKIYLEALDTQMLDAGTYYYDVWVFFLLTGKRFIVIKPTVLEILPSITYAPLL